MRSVRKFLSAAAIEAAFRDRPFLEQRKARIQWYLDLTVLGVALVYALISFVLSRRMLDGIIISATAVLLLLGLFALKRGRVLLAGNLILGLGFIALTLTAVSGTVVHHFKLYNIAFLDMFVLFIACLIGTSRLQIIAVSAASILVQVVYLAAVVLPVSEFGFWSTIDPLIASALLFLLATFSGLSLFSLFENVVSRLSEESDGIRKLNEGLGAALTTAGRGLEKGDLLVDSAERTRETAGAIAERARAVSDRVGILAGKAVEMETINTDVSRNIGVLGQVMENQGGIVETAATAIEQMNASIRNLSRISLSQAERTGLLAASAEKGRKDLEQGRTTIERLSRSIDSITEVVSIIDDLSNRTNLLAMNAAIEAAHAGDRGKGFAVVASEIRKLAETSAANTRRISETIKSTVEEIRESQAVNAASLELLQSMAAGAQETSRGMGEIRDALQELSTGTGEIDSAMNELRERTQTGHDTLSNTGIAIGSGIMNRDTTADVIRDVSESVADLLGRLRPLEENAARIRRVGEENRSVLEELSRTMERINDGN